MKHRARADGLVMEALLHTLRRVTRGAQWLCLLLLALFFCSGFQTVGPGDTALRLRLGRLQPGAHGPGLMLALPAPFDEIIRIKTGAEHALTLDRWEPRGPRIEREDKAVSLTPAEMIAEQESLAAGTGLLKNTPEPIGDDLDPVLDGYTITGDWNVIQGRFTLRYRITDAVAFFRAGPHAEPLLADLAYRAITHALSRVKIDRALTDERDQLARAICAAISAEAEKIGLGVTATALEMRDLAPPRQVVAAFEDVISARLFAKTLTENAEEYRLKQTAEAQGQGSAIRQRAEAYASKLTASAEGEAEAFRRFYAEYEKSPALVSARLYTETVGAVMRQVGSTTLLPPGSPPPNLLVEPSADLTR